ncbi:type VII secretion protein EccB [Amycolatopsis cynarae]|uniref:Type VII secretion protein EccB n=1 Tax=Amycolatopsis cynarae TaxID=2995223 RepID=A0ABY7BD67_9PSEU|nr:type VII secretion protein EccB [Amycolatopsis sp. HUAS 11-8]WAL69890.1 type VII secretion protein EccB [Amycolatopsis sp. HUAS 11-8]
MQSALVRRDSVMLHDPMRTHGRATLVGFILGLLGVVGFVIFGLINPSPSVPDSGIVIGKESGTIYVVSGSPKSLTPTFNLASARLLLMALQKGGNTQVSPPTVVPDDSLKGIPHNRRTGIVDGPQLLPTSGQRISDDWGICDQLMINDRLPTSSQLQKATLQTTVFAGQSKLGDELSVDAAVLVQADNGKYYLIYRLPNNPNDPNANTVRAEVDPNQAAVLNSFHLNPGTVRHISIGLLNSIPLVPPLAPPQIPGVGNSTSFPALKSAGLHVGSVFKINSVSGKQDVYVLLQNGIQQVSQAVGDLIRTAQAGNREVPAVSPDKISEVRQIQQTDPDFLPVSTMPSVVPTILDPITSPVTCLGWNIVNNQPHTVVSVGSTLPVPKDGKLIDIGKPNPEGQRIDHFYMSPGHGAVVQSATGAATFNRGPISLITDTGLRYGIPDENTAKALGLDGARPAPEAIIALLPTGTSLNVTDAQKSYDDIPVAPSAGSYPSQQQQQQQQQTSSAPGGN